MPGVGCRVETAAFTHINEASAPAVHQSGSAADVIVNYTGLSAGKLGGVDEKDLYPIRGQIVLVQNDPGIMYSQAGNDDSSDESSYITTRAAGGGTVLRG